MIMLLWSICGMPDWLDAEMVIVFAMAAGGVYIMWSENRAYRRETEERVELHARLATLERDVEILGQRPTVERVAKIEVAIGGERPSSIDARVAELEGWAERIDTSIDLAARMAAIESRIDFKPITHTRRKDGKFAKPGDAMGLVTCADEETR